ncbi:MAG TPA: hypothetical protein VFW94_24280 [Candidatus Acidoferrales bacterium]|nr:hypothetical protein [Candidatus Acidoferrales bacterium]
MNGIRALQDQPLSGPKVGAFAPNLGENKEKSTNDTWMAVFAGVDPNRINEPRYYHTVTAKIRAAAKRNDIDPRQAQAAIWSFIKALAELSGWGKDRWIPPDEIIKQGLFTPELVNKHAADFADLLANDKEIRAQIKDAGGNLNALDEQLAKHVPARPEPGADEELDPRLLASAERLEAARHDARIQAHLAAKSDLQASLFDTEFEPGIQFNREGKFYGDKLAALREEANRLRPGGAKPVNAEMNQTRSRSLAKDERPELERVGQNLVDQIRDANARRRGRLPEGLDFVGPSVSFSDWAQAMVRHFGDEITDGNMSLKDIGDVWEKVKPPEDEDIALPPRRMETPLIDAHIDPERRQLGSGAQTIDAEMNVMPSARRMSESPDFRGKSSALTESERQELDELEQKQLTGKLTPDELMRFHKLSQKELSRFGVQLSPEQEQQLIQYRFEQTHTPEFKKWFAGSKAVGEDGKPLVVYHGTQANFGSFDPNKLGDSNWHPSADTGFFFSASPLVASNFSGRRDERLGGDPYRGGANVIPAYVSIKNPFEISNADWKKFLRAANSQMASGKDLRASLEAKGYDGIHVIGDPEDQPKRFNEQGWDQWVAFHPEQIKSAIGNAGTFDSTNPDITMNQSPRTAAGWQSSAPREVVNQGLHGMCGPIAIALHRKTGLPIFGAFDKFGYLHHLFVSDGEHAIDIRGSMPLENVAVRSKAANGTIKPMTEEQVYEDIKPFQIIEPSDIKRARSIVNRYLHKKSDESVTGVEGITMNLTRADKSTPVPEIEELKAEALRRKPRTGNPDLDETMKDVERRAPVMVP